MRRKGGAAVANSKVQNLHFPQESRGRLVVFASRSRIPPATMGWIQDTKCESGIRQLSVPCTCLITLKVGLQRTVNWEELQNLLSLIMSQKNAS